jgi:hypothetical protein
MSSLTDIDKRYLEKILEMGSGFVLDYSDCRYGEFFNRYNIDIHGIQYQTYGTSKAKKMRAFWGVEPDNVVAPVLKEMLASYEADCELNGREVERGILEKSKAIVARLGGETSDASGACTENVFLSQDFEITNLHKLPVEPQVIPIIEQRINEARVALKAGAYLSVVLLCGSVLEGVLLGAAQRYPEKFNRASASPKNKDGKVRALYEWSLAQMIDTASEVGLLKLDVKKFSHGLRDFRNFIHPYEQLVSGFTPDQHTAKVCFQVLSAALASLAGER